MTDAQIKYMVSRFLQWRLPDSFSPDGGVSFAPSFKEEPMRSRHWPVGTNVLDAVQADAMVRHMLDGLPDEVAFRDKLLSCVCLLEVMAESAKKRDDTVEWAMMSVMAKDGREVLDGYHAE